MALGSDPFTYLPKWY